MKVLNTPAVAAKHPALGETNCEIEGRMYESKYVTIPLSPEESGP